MDANEKKEEIEENIELTKNRVLAIHAIKSFNQSKIEDLKKQATNGNHMNKNRKQNP